MLDMLPSLDMLPVKNTFLHFSAPPARPARCNSAPPKSSGELLCKLADDCGHIEAEKDISVDGSLTPPSLASLDTASVNESRGGSSSAELFDFHHPLLETDGDEKDAHEMGACKPCMYYAFKPDSCRKGDACDFCHLCSQEQAKLFKNQLKKEKRREKNRQAAAARGSRRRGAAAAAGLIYAGRAV